MNILVIDLTHGGVKIAVSIAKKTQNVYCWDIYNTLDEIDRKMLDVYGVKLIGLEDISNFKGDLKVIHPVHLPLTRSDIEKHNPNLNYTFITHHQAIREILDGWGDDINRIEVTGVKGKTSSVFMLKEILIDSNPLLLSSLGAFIYNDGCEKVLKKNLSITPANIKETVDLAYKVANPVCGGEVKGRIYGCAVFESSLGGCGIGDVGLLTNIIEDYPIARGRSSASAAKRQIFNCNIVCCEKKALDKYYSTLNHSGVNSFSLSDEEANLFAKSIEFDLYETVINIHYNNVKTVTGGEVTGDITVKTFAPGSHNVLNVLGVVETCLSLNIDECKIVNGLMNYKGIAGRSNLKKINNSIIIEEINPGINTKAIEASLDMVHGKNYIVCIGGDYGITCEEIDEEKLADLIERADDNIVLTGDVGRNIAENITGDVMYVSNYEDIYDFAVENNMNLLFIYRSDYKTLSKR